MDTGHPEPFSTIVMPHGTGRSPPRAVSDVKIIAIVIAVIANVSEVNRGISDSE
jgi:hypothetical protein